MGKTDGVGNAMVKIMTYILVALLVLGVAGGVVALVMRDRGVTFFVEAEGNKYFANDVEGYVTLTDKISEFSVSALSGEKIDYTVEVTVNATNNFEFTVDGESHVLYGNDQTLNDYTSVFAITKTETGFTLTVPDGFNLQSVLEEKYGGEVVLPYGLDMNVSYFTLTVTSGGSKAVINLLLSVEPSGLSLSQSNIIF